MNRLFAALAGLVAAAVVMIVRRGPRARSPVVLGSELANAIAAENRRLRFAAGPSPMAGMAYDAWRGDLDLLRTVPAPLDARIADVCRRFASMSLPDRTSLREAISLDDCYTLLAFARRSAVFSRRERSGQRLRDGLFAVALVDSQRVDYRDIPVALSLLSHAAAQLGGDTRATFDEAAALAEPRVAEFIRSSARPHDVRPATGYHEVATTYGIGFIGWGLRPYAPTYDFVALAMALAEMVEADQYRPTSIDIATDLPAVWLKAAGGSAVATLEQARAGATVHGALRPGVHSSYADQWLLAFLVELPTSDAAEVLRAASATLAPTTYSLLGVARERLFCLIIARSVREGVASYESAAGLSRFASPVETILSQHVHQG